MFNLIVYILFKCLPCEIELEAIVFGLLIGCGGGGELDRSPTLNKNMHMSVVIFILRAFDFCFRRRVVNRRVVVRVGEESQW